MAPPPPRVVIDLTAGAVTDEDDGERLPATPTSAPVAVYCQTIELLAPLYPEIKARTAATRAGDVAVFPVTFQRTEADWIKVVFPHVSSSPTNFQSPPLEKELACVNSTADGCRNCRFAQLLRGLLVLIEKRVFIVDAKYVVSFPAKRNAGGSDATNANTAASSASPRTKSNPGPPPIATIQLSVQLNERAPKSIHLKEFDFVVSHLQPAILSVVGYTRVRQEDPNAAEDAVKQAKQSSCHVMGCSLHQNDGKLPGLTSEKLFLSDVFQSLTAPANMNQMEIRDDATYLKRMKQPQREVIITDLPITALQLLVCMMNARDLAALSGVCSLFQHLSYEVAPGLNLVLYRHQQKALKFLLYREAPPSAHMSSIPHPFVFPPVRQPNMPISIDLVDGRILQELTPAAQDSRGGLFCDEPGLGKTITMLALLLRTKGQRVKAVTAPCTVPAERDGPLGRLRSSEARGRTVLPHTLIKSASTLIIVPDPLVEHWKYQIETHVEPGALNVYIDNGKTLPTCQQLATYDAVITSFTRLAQEWKWNRPVSALEARAPERYGFEDTARFIDGEIRGELSALLRIHWVRIVVDEGHKLGGTTETSQMRMARVFHAEKRWVMTGTPTPNTLQSADLRHMHGLLVFLQDAPYGNPDGKAWLKAVAKPFERNEPIAFLRVKHLLSRIMMRHTKHSIRDILPDPIRRVTIIDPTPKEYDVYNAVAASVRANLVATNYDPKYPGRLHLDSLLNPINRKYAKQVVSNLRTASCGGMVMKILMTQKALVEAVNYAKEKTQIEGERLTVVLDYIRKAQESGMSTPCGRCNRRFQLLMVIPCGHLCCADCTGDCMESMGPHCPICNTVFDIEIFQELQPGFEFAFEGSGPLDDLTQQGAGARFHQREREEERRQNLRAWQERQRNGEPRVPRPFLAINYLRDFDIVDASKALYVVARVKELKQEYANAYAEASNSRTYAPRHLKAIVFSQFNEHIWSVKIAFAQQGIPTADFIGGVSSVHRMKYLAEFRNDPKVNVLLLTEMGSHGLDLSFVTHMFLMEEIWDKSLEKQVVSRAHRMGARQAVVVEQLVMRDTIEGVLLRMNDQILKRQERRLEAEEAEMEVEMALRYEEQLQQQHRHSNKLNGTGNLEGTFRLHHKSKKRHHKSASALLPKDANEKNKASRLQQQLYHVLQHLRLLNEDVVAEPGHVRFTIEDENGSIVRKGSHRMAAYKSSAGQLVMVPPVDAAPAFTTATSTSRASSSTQASGSGSMGSSQSTNVKAEPNRGPGTSTPSMATSPPKPPSSGGTSQTSKTKPTQPAQNHQPSVTVVRGNGNVIAPSSNSQPAVVKPELPRGENANSSSKTTASPSRSSNNAVAAAVAVKTERSSETCQVATQGTTTKAAQKMTSSSTSVKVERPQDKSSSHAQKYKVKQKEKREEKKKEKKKVSASTTSVVEKETSAPVAKKKKKATAPSMAPLVVKTESSTPVVAKHKPTAVPAPLAVKPEPAVQTVHSSPPTSSAMKPEPSRGQKRKRTQSQEDATAPSLGGSGTLHDPVLLVDSDDDPPIMAAPPTVPSVKYEASPAKRAAVTSQPSPASRKAQKRPIKRVTFERDESETESEYAPSDSMSDD
ncbi:F-box protein, partial [Globisporangium splendens]